MRYEPKHRIWLCAMSQSTGFGYALRGVALNLVVRYGSLRKTK
jgi:hypothetical protein